MLRLDKEQALVQLELERERSAAFGGCVMCRLASPEHAGEWIAESAHGVVALDGYGATRGHLLVIARRHVERGSELDWPVFSDLQRLVWQASRALQAELSPARVYVASLGAIRPLPMSFPHHHTHVVPIYETMEGWTESTRGARSWAELPAQCIKYVRRLEELIGAPVALLSTSPKREDTILVHDPFVD